MALPVPVRLGAAENTLIDQLKSVGADATAERITMAGLPTRRVEAYHYTDLKTLLRTIPPLAQAANEASAPALRVPGAYQLMIANGVIQAASTAPAALPTMTPAMSPIPSRSSWPTARPPSSSKPFRGPMLPMSAITPPIWRSARMPW